MTNPQQHGTETVTEISNHRQMSEIRIMIIAHSEQQRLAFNHTLTQLGFTVVDCLAPESVSEDDLQQPAELWLLDTGIEGYEDSCVAMQLYATLDAKLEASNSCLAVASISDCERVTAAAVSDEQQPSRILIGFEQAPRQTEGYLYSKWQRKLQRKLAQLLDLPQLSVALAAARYQPWRYVLLLLADAQDLAQVQSLLAQLPSTLPVSILLVMTGEADLIAESGWRCQTINGALNMQAGHCYLAPLTQQIVCDSTGRIIVSPQRSEQYQRQQECQQHAQSHHLTQSSLPQALDVQALFSNCSEVFAEQLLAVRFDAFTHLQPKAGCQTFFDAGKIAAENNSTLWQLTGRSTQEAPTVGRIATQVVRLCQ